MMTLPAEDGLGGGLVVERLRLGLGQASIHLGVVGERGSRREGRVSARFGRVREVESALSGYGPAIGS